MSRDYETDHEHTNVLLAQIRDALESIAVTLAKIAERRPDPSSLSDTALAGRLHASERRAAQEDEARDAG